MIRSPSQQKKVNRDCPLSLNQTPSATARTKSSWSRSRHAQRRRDGSDRGQPRVFVGVALLSQVSVSLSLLLGQRGPYPLSVLVEDNCNTLLHDKTLASRRKDSRRVQLAGRGVDRAVKVQGLDRHGGLDLRRLRHRHLDDVRLLDQPAPFVLVEVVRVH